MPAAVRPYVTAGVALVGASVISVSPIAPQPVAERVSGERVTLTAAAGTFCVPDSTSALCEALTGTGADAIVGTNAVTAAQSSLFYIPANLVNALLSLPAWEIQAMDRLADAMIATGSWQVWGPTNVFGFDEQDPPKLKAFIDMLMPFKPFSSALGEHMSVWAQANLPMNSGCAGTPGACPDINALLANMFKVPTSELYDGYTFPEAGEQGSTNPFNGVPVSWAGTTVQLEPWSPFKDTWEWLTSPPKPVETVPASDYFSVPLKLIKATFDAYYPFVQNSGWFNPQNGLLAVVSRALAPLLCPSCDQDNLYDNPWLYENYDPHPPVATDEAADAATLAAPAGAAESEGGPEAEGAGQSVDPLASAVAGLKKKFEAAPAVGDDATSEDDTSVDPGDDTTVDDTTDEDTSVDDTVDDTAVDEGATVDGDDADESTETTGKHRRDSTGAANPVKDTDDGEGGGGDTSPANDKAGSEGGGT